MGIKATDLNILSATGPTVTIPGNKDPRKQFFQFSRTTTTATIVARLPGDASITSVVLFGSANSNAGTTATATFTIANNSGTISTGTVNLLTGGATTAMVAMSNLPNLENIPIQGDLTVTVQYAETGTVSTLGGPWTCEVNFVR